jgi:signal transduction histidine kinase/CheY-like chemotaxis protein
MVSEFHMSQPQPDSGYIRGMMDACPMAMWALSPDGVIEHVHPAARDMADHDNTAPAAIWRDCWPEETRFTVDRALETARAGGPATFRARLSLAGAGHIYVETVITPMRDRSGALAGLSACMRNVTAETEATAFLNSVIQLLPLSLTVRDLNSGLYVLANPVAEDLFEAGPEGMTGRTPADVLGPDRSARILANDAEALLRGSTRVVVDSTKPHGPPRKLSSTRVVTFDDSGPRHLITLTEDITETTAAAAALQEALDQAQKAARAKTTFVANLRHEIRTPLNGLIAGADMLSQEILDPRARQLVDVIRTTGLALEAKLENVLELVRLDQGRMTLNPAPFRVDEMLQAAALAASSAAKAKGLAVQWSAPELAGVMARGDVAQIGQILKQLLDNAVKFTTEGQITLSAGKTANGIRFAVADTGIGMAPGEKASLFKRFAQSDTSLARAQGGLGVGLALAQELAGLMGGAVDCAPQPGGGTVFWCELQLPLVRTANQAPSAAPQAGDHPLHILVADDHVTNRRVVELVLGELATVHSVNDGRAAIDAFVEHPYDLVLMDIQMPVLDGISAVTAIRRFEKASRRPRTPIAMLSANTEDEYVLASRRAGADRHIGKPFTANVLIGAVRELLTPPSGQIHYQGIA